MGSMPSAEQCLVAVGVLNFRAGPGTQFPIQGKLARHHRIDVIG